MNIHIEGEDRYPQPQYIISNDAGQVLKLFLNDNWDMFSAEMLALKLHIPIARIRKGIKEVEELGILEKFNYDNITYYTIKHIYFPINFV